MTDEMIALARRAVACKGWKWMPGMRWTDDDDRGRLDDYQPEYMGRPPDALPDLTDAATLGCLLALVREAWGGDFEQVWSEWYPLLSRWGIRAGSRSVLLVSGETEADALVAALEAA